MCQQVFPFSHFRECLWSFHFFFLKKQFSMNIYLYILSYHRFVSLNKSMEILLNNPSSHDQDDPNRLWVDIDRGLCSSSGQHLDIFLSSSGIRSKEPQRQFEAILKMPTLFKRETTSTTLISAALIKLATLFQEGYH